MLLLIEIIILSLFFFNHCHSYIAVHFLEIFLLLVYIIFGYRLIVCKMQNVEWNGLVEWTRGMDSWNG